MFRKRKKKGFNTINEQLHDYTLIEGHRERIVYICYVYLVFYHREEAYDTKYGVEKIGKKDMSMIVLF